MGSWSYVNGRQPGSPALLFGLATLLAAISVAGQLAALAGYERFATASNVFSGLLLPSVPCTSTG